MLLHDIILKEEVFSTLAVAYHRTRNVQITQDISKTGFRAGGGRTYGVGIYLTYSFDDQQDERMKATYGPFVIRCKVNLADFLIFDRDIAVNVYGAKFGLTDQLSHFGIKPTDEKLALVLQQAAEADSGTAVSAVAAKTFSRWLVANRRSVPRPIKGLVFTGRQDGRVIVAYDRSVVIPFAWAKVIDLNKTRELVKWNKIATPPIRQPAKPVSQLERAVAFFRAQGFQPKRYPSWMQITMMLCKRKGDHLILGMTGHQRSMIGIRCACTKHEPTENDFGQMLNGHPELVDGWPLMDEVWRLRDGWRNSRNETYRQDNLPLQAIADEIFAAHDRILAGREDTNDRNPAENERAVL